MYYHLKAKGGLLMSNDSEFKANTGQLRTMEELLEAIPEPRPSKVSFTVTIQSSMNDKFNEIWAHYQTKHSYGRVYKNQVLQLIIDEVHSRMKGQRLL
jgi:hypothetical protein